MNVRSVDELGSRVAEQMLVLLLVVFERGTRLELDVGQPEFGERVADQESVEPLVVALVVVTHEVVVRRRRFVCLIVESTDLLGCLDDRAEGRHVLDELGENAEASLSCFVEENVGARGDPPSRSRRSRSVQPGRRLRWRV